MRISDWSSDVCSSDLLREDDRQIDYSIGIDNAVHSHRPIINESADGCGEFAKGRNDGGDVEAVQQAAGPGKSQGTAGSRRSAERRVGKECVGTGMTRWSTDQ